MAQVEDGDGGVVTYDLSSLTGQINGPFLADDGLARAAEAVHAGQLPEVDLAARRVGVPVARPGAVLCIGMNDAAHAAESGAAPPEQPVLFLKTPNTVGGPDDPVQIPGNIRKTDWEVELSVVIGRQAWQLSSPEEAVGCVAGYAVANDLSERTWQLEESGGQWSKGKCAPGYTPLGPGDVVDGDRGAGMPAPGSRGGPGRREQR